MDIYCKRCGEPWDMDTLHDEIDYRCDGNAPDGDAYGELYRTVRSDFYARGCRAFTYAVGENPSWCKATGSARAAVAGALYDAFGDDLDGVASDLMDAEYLGLFR